MNESHESSIDKQEAQAKLAIIPGEEGKVKVRISWVEDGVDLALPDGGYAVSVYLKQDVLIEALAKAGIKAEVAVESKDAAKEE